MEMSSGEIVKSYQNRKGSQPEQIRILAELNETTKAEIEKILMAAGEEVPQRKPKAKLKETKKIPEVLLTMAYDKLDDLDREIQYHRKKMEEAAIAYKEIVDFIGITPEVANE